MPWVFLGDFNVDLHIRERSDYCFGMALTIKESDFAECLDLTSLTDIPSLGSYYTWSNKILVGFLAKKLGRALGNLH